jgi:hypothetical protein
MTATIAPFKVGARVMHMRTGATLRLTEPESCDSATVWARVTTPGPRFDARTNVLARDVLPLDEAGLQHLLRATTCFNELGLLDIVARLESLSADATRRLEEGVNGP